LIVLLAFIGSAEGVRPVVCFPGFRHFFQINAPMTKIAKTIGIIAAGEVKVL